jgi:hypothetical protein
LNIDWEKYKPPPDMMEKILAKQHKDEDFETDEDDEIFDETVGYNLWVGHTDFNLRGNLMEAVQFVDGVESLENVSRYRFRVGIGKMFDEDVVKENIEKVMKKFVDPLGHLVDEMSGSAYWAVAKENGVYFGIRAKNQEHFKMLIEGKNVIKSWEDE